MEENPPAENPPHFALREPCVVCGQPATRTCDGCGARCYCSRTCGIIDRYAMGHRFTCTHPATTIDAAPGASHAAPGAASLDAAVPAPKTISTTAWRGTCAICLEVLAVESSKQVIYACCCQKTCISCSDSCGEYDIRCPYCRHLPCTSPSERIKWLRKHASQGNSEAMLQLGGAYFAGGFGLDQSTAAAFSFYEKAALQGHVRAMAVTGSCYAFGDGIGVDRKKAALWYRKAALQGHPNAQFNLGAALSGGIGVAQDHGEAVEWYKRAAAQGSQQAQYNLQVCLARGEGVAQDDALDKAIMLADRGQRVDPLLYAAAAAVAAFALWWGLQG